MKLTNTRIIILAFFALIVTGAVLLTLPVSSRSGSWTPPLDALFTAASATCVTGMLLFDTYTHWSLFGQLVILFLLQVGGIGFMSIVTMFSMLLKRKIGLSERQLIMQSSGIFNLSDVIQLLKKIVIGALLFEGIGAVILSFRFCPGMGLLPGIYNAVFHSVSAFCNAGIDLMGRYGQFSSLSAFADDPVVCLTVAALIVIGGLGFLVWNDVYLHRWRFRKYALHTKIVLTVTAVLLSVSVLGFFLLEGGYSMRGMTAPARWLNALFQSVTSRTAGFSTLDMAELSEPGRLLTMLLMFIGGNPGSTAGGLKTTTLLVIVLSAMTLTRRRQHIPLFYRRLTDDDVRNANALFAVYTGVILAAVFLISLAEPLSLREIVFEVISAIGTVGFSTGVTPQFGLFARVVIIALMFVGRVGLITLVMALHGNRRENARERVPEKILIG